MDITNNKREAIATKMNRKRGRARSSYKQKTKTKTTNRKGERLLQHKKRRQAWGIERGNREFL